jgi:hypothetical protein
VPAPRVPGSHLVLFFSPGAPVFHGIPSSACEWDFGCPAGHFIIGREWHWILVCTNRSIESWRTKCRRYSFVSREKWQPEGMLHSHGAVFLCRSEALSET